MFERTDGPKEERQNALWGKGERAGSRAAKLRARLGVLAAIVAALALAAPMSAAAGDFVYVAPTVDMSAEVELDDETLLEEDAAWNSVAWAS